MDHQTPIEGRGRVVIWVMLKKYSSLSSSFRFLPCKEILNLVDKLRELLKMSFVDLIKPFTNLHSSTQFTSWCCKDLSSVWFLGIQNRGKLNYLEKSALSRRRKVQAAGGHIKDSWAVGSGFRPLGHRHRHPLASISDLGIHYGDIYLGARH